MTGYQRAKERSRLRISVLIIMVDYFYLSPPFFIFFFFLIPLSIGPSNDSHSSWTTEPRAHRVGHAVSFDRSKPSLFEPISSILVRLIYCKKAARLVYPTGSRATTICFQLIVDVTSLTFD